ncbi:hypothetical protein ACNITO_26815, partial [Escherichia coli]
LTRGRPTVRELNLSDTLHSQPNSNDAQDPRFDKRTMENHHTKHPHPYVNTAHAAPESLPAFANRPLEDPITKLDPLPSDKKTVLR